MAGKVSRRGMVGGLSALAVVGFDPHSRKWVASAAAATTFEDLPPLQGALYLDDAHRAAAADDFGHLVHQSPVAVLVPGSVDDIVAMVRYARRHRIGVAMRGQGHAQYGQSQVAGGLVVDSSSLSAIHSISPSAARVDAGVRWSDLVVAAAERGLTPPVLTDYLELSVGGTLSVGGIGGTMQRFGVQGDNVLELEVVTGEGELVTCSRHHRRELFDAVTSGLGQFALIVRASVRLVPAPAMARVYNLFYDDVATFVRDQLRLVHEARFEYLEGQVVSTEAGGFRYMIEAASLFTTPCSPDEAKLLRGLNDDTATRQKTEVPYLDFAFRLAPTIEFLKSIGVWGFPHPWLSLFVPASRAASYVGNVVADLTTADTGQGPILFYPVLAARVQRPFFRLPNEPVSFAFNILRTASPDPAVQRAMVASNRTLYEAAVAIGGTRYASGAIPMDAADWRRHFGVSWRDFERAKRRFDPSNILTPGAGIFG
ncbi:MAG TPA: FAD-binding protein [Polyangiaceae bacterium]|nr:FAD-binding protein [Polyangiaceae bacterium]